LGSLSHFLKVLYKDSLNQNHFSIKRFKGIILDDQISVGYTNRTRYQFGDDNVSFHIKKQNDISANTINESFFIDKNGNVLNPGSVTVYGNWARSRVDNSLPDNYEIGD